MTAAPVARRLWLVRHGETAGESSIRYHGANDVPLSAAGRQQIRALVPWLRHVAFARIVHSPLSRAVESAALLIDGCGLGAAERAVDDRLRELSFGDCEGMTRAEIESAWPTFFTDYEAGRVDAFPGGEPRAAFAARIAAATRELVAAPWRDDLLVVAHRGTVRHALGALLGDAGGGAVRFGVPLGSLTVLREAPSGWQLELLGAVP